MEQDPSFCNSNPDHGGDVPPYYVLQTQLNQKRQQRKKRLKKQLLWNLSGPQERFVNNNNNRGPPLKILKDQV